MELIFVQSSTSQQLPNYFDNFLGIFIKSSRLTLGIETEYEILVFEISSLSLYDISLDDTFIEVGKRFFKKSTRLFASLSLIK